MAEVLTEECWVPGGRGGLNEPGAPSSVTAAEGPAGAVMSYVFSSRCAKTSFLMAFRALTTLFQEALGSDLSQESMAVSTRMFGFVDSSIFRSTAKSIPS